MLTTDRHEASRGLFATTELLVLKCVIPRKDVPFTSLNDVPLNSGRQPPKNEI